MAILAGIDEAGLGPTLGPLVVCGVAFCVPDDRLHECLWKTLRGTCTRRLRGGGRRLIIADSKQVYHSGADPSRLAPLERTALVMLAAAGQRPASWRALLDHLSPGTTPLLDRYPWYAGEDIALPIADGVGDLGTRANAVRRDGAEHDVTLLGVFSEPVLEGQYNHLVRATRNKASIVAAAALRVADRILKLDPQAHVRLCVDRLGGRKHYREELSTLLPGYDVRILEESDDRSAYRLTHASRVCEAEFAVEGESRHFPIALASMFSKYVRELFMHKFNAYWSQQVAGLRPTAGYFSDARRWLSDASAAMERLAIDRGILVRER